MSIEVGDLVACYLLNSSMEHEALLEHGIVLDVNPSLKDVLVLDSQGNMRWWSENRWRILQKTKNPLTSRKTSDSI